MKEIGDIFFDNNYYKIVHMYMYCKPSCFNYCLLFIAVRPSLVKEKNQPMAPEGKGFKVSCSVEKGNPPPTFKWQYQNMKCTDASDPDCQPDESQWAMVPERLMITPSATPTNKSIVLVESDQGQTLYRCQAFNNLGNDSRVIRFLRLGKNC